MSVSSIENDFFLPLPLYHLYPLCHLCYLGHLAVEQGMFKICQWFGDDLWTI